MPNYPKTNVGQPKDESKKKKRYVTPVPKGALGTGLAERAAEATRARKRRLQQY